MQSFTYHEPVSLQEMASLLESCKNTKILAGGTDLLVQIRKGVTIPQHVVNIKTISGLNQISETREGINIGAAVTMHEAEKVLVKYPEFQVLCQAMHSVGSCQIRNRATLAGNICNASPAGDTIPALAVLGAKVCIYGPKAKKIIDIGEFITGPRRTVLAAGEFVTAIILPVQPGQARGCFIKKARRPSVDISTVSVAAWTDSKEYRIALGAVGPTVIRPVRAECLLSKTGFSTETIETAARFAAQAVAPITDLRGSKDYRIELVEVLTARALTALREEGMS